MGVAKNRLLWLIVAAVAARLLFAQIYPIKTFYDTQTYVEPARQITSGDYSAYEGRRAPVYPLLLAGVNYNFESIVFFQTVLGVGTAVLVYLIFGRISRNENVAFVAGIVHAVNPSQLLFEFSVVSEAVCVFLLTLTVFILFRSIDQTPRWKSWLSYLGLGVSCALCVLTRPQYQTLPVLIAAFLYFNSRTNRQEMIRRLTFFILPPALLIGAWISFQHSKIGQFSVTTDLGVSLMSNVIYYIESAPAEYDSVKNIIIQAKNEQLKRSSDLYSALVPAVAQIRGQFHLTYPETSKLLTRISVATIKEKPGLYAANVFKGLIRFFKPTWYSRNFGVRGVLAGDYWPSKIVVVIFAAFHVFSMLVFLAFPLVGLIRPKQMHRCLLRPEIAFIYFLTAISALSVAMVGYMENARYKTSTEPLMLATAVWIVHLYLSRKSEGADLLPHPESDSKRQTP